MKAFLIFLNQKIHPYIFYDFHKMTIGELIQTLFQ